MFTLGKPLDDGVYVVCFLSPDEPNKNGKKTRDILRFDECAPDDVFVAPRHRKNPAITRMTGFVSGGTGGI